MTDKQKLEAIKAEIERRKNEAFLNASFNECKQFILNELQKFIASLDEQSEKNLKEFNVEKYYKNPERKVVTRDGREVEILKIDTKTKTGAPVIAMMDGNDIRFFTTNGRLSLERETCSDLFFADVDCDTTNDNDLAKSNEEKASEIANKYSGREIYRIAIIEAMEWKDRQFKQELDNAFKSADHVQYTNGYNKAVEKAWQYIKENYGGDYASETLMSECKKFFVEYMQEDEE